MIVYDIYKALKTRLTTTFPGTPVFYYIGQYLQGKDNLSLRVPAIYIEMPSEVTLNFYGRKLMTAKDAAVKIHYISYAPFKNADNVVQETAIQEHEARLKEIDTLVTGWHAAEPGIDGRKLTEQFIPGSGNLLQFQKMALVSVLRYSTEIYSRHLQGS